MTERGFVAYCFGAVVLTYFEMLFSKAHSKQIQEHSGRTLNATGVWFGLRILRTCETSAAKGPVHKVSWCSQPTARQTYGGSQAPVGRYQQTLSQLDARILGKVVIPWWVVDLRYRPRNTRSGRMERLYIRAKVAIQRLGE